MTAMFVPAGTPDAVVTRLSETISAYLQTDAARALFRAQGVEAVGSTSEVLATTMQSEMERLAALIEKLNLREKK